MAPKASILAAACAYMASATAQPLAPRQATTESKQIVGGELAALGEIPYIVSLSLADGSHFCGGSLVNENTVVTAAHCVVDSGDTDIFVRAGSILASTGGIRVGSSQVISHPNYDPMASSSDLAIIKLAEPISAGGDIAYISLPEPGSDLPGGITVQVAGWGATTTGGTDPSDELLFVQVPSVDRETCNGPWEGSIDNTMVCAGKAEGGEDACFGDSGGPLVDLDSGVLVGAVSYGRPCAQPNFPTVYANIGGLLDFITTNL